MVAKKRIYTNGTAKGQSFAARYRKEVRRLAGFVQTLHEAEYKFELYLDCTNWQFVARLYCPDTEGESSLPGWNAPQYIGYSIGSPEQAMEVLGRSVAAAVKKQASANVQALTRHEPKLGQAVSNLLRSYGML